MTGASATALEAVIEDALIDDQIINLNILGDCASLRLCGEEVDSILQESFQKNSHG